MIVIAGGGLAAQRCCERLRRKDYDGRIVMVCDEPHAPYDRPPLSKQFLAGEMTEPPRFRPDAWYEENEITLLLGERVSALHADARAVGLESGGLLRYDRLLIATGAAPRMLPGCEQSDNVHVLRTVGDAERLRDRLRDGGRVAVVGAGFIGQEVASTARSIGADVTLVEAMPAPLAHILGPAVGGWFGRLHREHGVDVRAGVGFEAMTDDGIRLAGGVTIECEEVVVGIGVTAATGWLRGTPIGPNGTAAVRADHAGRTCIPDVFAAGDCAGSQHWEAAVQQGAAAAMAMLGEDLRPPTPASIWSDLYGMRINWLGDARGADSVEIEGDPDACDFSVIYRRDECVIGGLLIGRPHALAQLRKELQ